MRIPFPVRAIPSLTFRAWLTPPPLGSTIAERDRDATEGLSPFQAGDIAGYETGDGPLVMAAHGWGGRTAQFAPVARSLAAEGYRVVIPELPGHAGGEVTDIKKVAAAIRSVIDTLGDPEVLIGHSFASMVLRLAFPSKAPPRVVLIAPSLDVIDALDVFGDRLRLLPWARRGLKARLKAWDPALWPTVSQILPEQLPGAEILIVHDPQDGDTPFARSAELAAIRPNTSLVPVDGVGHSRVLSDPAVLQLVASFVGEKAVSGDNVA